MTTAPHLWTRRPVIIEPDREIVLPARMQGWFKIEAGKRDGRRRLLADWFPNLITNSGLNAIGTLDTWMQQARVGSGTNAPNVGDTGLQTQVATTGTDNLQARTRNAQPAEPYYGQCVTTYRFGEGVAAGNLAEVGIGANGGILFSRARILDGSGNPTTITVLADEFLDVTYALRLYPPIVDVADAIMLAGNPYDYIIRAARVTDVSYWGVLANNTLTAARQNGSLGLVWTQAATASAHTAAIAAITSFPSGGTSSNSTTHTAQAYTNDNFYRDCLVIWGLNNGNLVGGINSIQWRTGQLVSPSTTAFGAYQMGFTPAIPKTNAQILTFSIRSSWARKTL
jgi:hypothetical protein